MATLIPQDVPLTGMTPSYDPCNGAGDDFPNNGQCYLHVKNGSGGALTVEVADVGTPTPVGADAFDADVTVSVGAGSEQLFGPFPIKRFGRSVSLAYAGGVGSLTIAVLRV